MTISNKTTAIIIVSMMTLIAFSCIFLYFKKHSYDDRIIALQNMVAERDKTIEIQKNVYTKLVTQMENFTSIVDKDMKELMSELKKRDEQIYVLDSLVIRWKKAYEAEVAAHQSDQPGNTPNDPVRKKVEFEKDFGYIGVKGHTLTDPPEAKISITQNRPLKITLALTQDSDKRWHTYATTSEDNVAIDIAISAINPLVVSQRWYEKISVDASLGVGSGVLFGVGTSYKLGKFKIGPSIWIGASNHVDKYYGMNVSWNPF